MFSYTRCSVMRDGCTMYIICAYLLKTDRVLSACVFNNTVQVNTLEYFEHERDNDDKTTLKIENRSKTSIFHIYIYRHFW